MKGRLQARLWPERVAPWWLLLAGASVVGMALWLRTMAGWSLAVTALAVALALAGASRARAGHLGTLGVAILALFLFAAGLQQRRLLLVERQWASYSGGVADGAADALQRAVERESRQLRAIARSALNAPDEASAAFRFLATTLGSTTRYRGVVLQRGTEAVAWSGELRSPPDSSSDSVAVAVTPFYITLRAVAEGEGRRALASAILHAEPPADRLTFPLDEAIAGAAELRGFAYAPPVQSDSGWHVLTAAGTPLLAVRPTLLAPGEAGLRIVERARITGVIGLVVSWLMLMAVAWRRPASLSQRLLALAISVMATATIPLNAFSNVAEVFDPGVYFAAFGGPLTGNIAALTVTSALTLLGFFALTRSRQHLRTRWPGVAGVLLVASLGPFLLRDIARGIALPVHGPTTTLWLWWQLALFLAGAAMLLAGSSAGRLALGGSRGLSPALAPLLAALGALLAPVIWVAPGRWPGWYSALWIAAMGALALARRSRTLVLSVGIVAACGATTLSWGFVSRRRVELAQSDVARLSRPDPAVADLIDRFATELAPGPPPLEREDLLLRFVRSPLAEASHPLEMASWLPGQDRPHAELRIADFARRAEGEGALVAEARATGERVWRNEPSPQGTQTVVAVPHPDGAVTTLVVAPRSLLIPDDPFSQLVGLATPVTTEPPYDLTLTTLPSPSPIGEAPRWTRRGNELHGDWRLPDAPDSARVHVEVELRGLEVLLPRGALIVLLDLLVLSGLWTLAAGSDGALARWGRHRLRRWARSYRGRLTVTLFAFFVIPAGGFAFWSYRRLLETDRESRVLLVRETLRTVTTAPELEGGGLEALGDRFDTPLLEYRGGRLREASDALYESLAPVGRYLPPSVAIELGVESEVLATERPIVAGAPMLFGYRTARRASGGGRTVLSAPARTNERALDRERRDIGILVLLVTSLGALAALGLSGLAARELERPIGALRRAALRIARGERYPALDAPPAVEFVPVFSAFERMDADLAASRAALEAAQRRTEAVLRNVASGVIALDLDGRVTIANPSAEAMLGGTVAPGGSLAELGAPSLDERTRAFLARDAEEEAFDATFGERQLRGILTRLARGSGGAVLTLDDVTDLARAQRVLAWGEMARQVAHEIKNPLTPMRLGVQHLRRARGDPRVNFERVFEQNMSRILEEIDRLDEIARAFSRYGMAPAEQAAPEAVDVAAIVRDVVELEQLGESEIVWQVSGATEPVRAMARDSELREVLLNLLENARQARAHHVTVSLARRDNGVQVLVADDGDGIPAEILPRVFEPQFSTRSSGSGLGLAISRGMVQAWGGEMGVTSDRGGARGTEMRITLPAAPEA